MGRWQPDARGRLGQAALELYGERGYEQATVAEIAERAGLTARTFFRHFTDKREVLFAGSDTLGENLVEAVQTADAAAPPFAVVVAALEAVCQSIGEDRDYSLRRQAVIDVNAELKERELAKLASWSRTLADGLIRRGVDEPTACLAAETAVAVFRVACDQWLAGPTGPVLVDVLRESVDRLRAVTGPTGGPVQPEPACQLPASSRHGAQRAEVGARGQGGVGP